MIVSLCNFSQHFCVCVCIFDIMISLFQSSRSQEAAARYALSIQQLPKPRKVSLGENGDRQIFGYLLVFGICCFIGVSVIRDNWHAGDIPFAFFVSAIPFFGAGMILYQVYKEYLNLALLKSGECCPATVTSQRKAGRRGTQSVIDYGFSDNAGRSGVGSGNDLTLRYAENMSVPVFYESARPSRNVAICCTIWKIDEEFALQGNVNPQDLSF